MSNLLILCTGNSCRSQMAEAWARQLLAPTWQVYSAGVEKHGLNPHMLTVMQEAGCNMCGHSSKTIEELPAISWDLVLTVCDNAAARCPYFPAAKMLHIPFADPPALSRGMPIEDALVIYRRVRDEIRATLTELASTLNP